jgi:DNA-binding LytR/AlgR family response regulator
MNNLSGLLNRNDDDAFIRIHPSYLCNVQHVSEVLDGKEEDADTGGVALLEDGTRLPVTRDGLDLLRAAMDSL